MFGLPPAHYQKWPALAAGFHMTSTSKDRCLLFCLMFCSSSSIIVCWG